MFQWMATKKYAACTEEEKADVVAQLRDIIATSETSILCISIPQRRIRGIRVPAAAGPAATPVCLSLAEVVALIVEHTLLEGRPFVVHNYGSGVAGEYVLSFVHGLPVAPVPPAVTLEC
jgi:hypothetical protein